MVNSLYVAKPDKLMSAAHGTSPVSNRKDRILVVKMFNVGSGEAILVIFPRSRAWLIDGGTTNSDPKNELLGGLLANYLHNHNLTLHAIVASHPHKDHVGAVSYLLALRPRLASRFTYYYTDDPPGRISTKPWYQKLETQLEKLGDGVEKINMIDSNKPVQISDRVYVHLLAGSGEEDYTSIFMHVHFRDATFLFTGDSECHYENKLLGIYSKHLFRSDLLKITHHGSSTGTSKKLVNAVKPAMAIASTATDCDHKLESGVKRRLPKCKTLETLVHGDITIRTEGRSVGGGVLYEIKWSDNGSTHSRGEFAAALGVKDKSQRALCKPQKSARECLAQP